MTGHCISRIWLFESKPKHEILYYLVSHKYSLHEMIHITLPNAINRIIIAFLLQSRQWTYIDIGCFLFLIEVHYFFKSSMFSFTYSALFFKNILYFYVNVLKQVKQIQTLNKRNKEIPMGYLRRRESNNHWQTPEDSKDKKKTTQTQH